MGARGPAPRREDERRRRNKPERPAQKLTQAELDELPFEIDYEPAPPEPPVDEPKSTTEGWHPYVQQLWDAMQVDPARKWMTSGDWAALALVLESLSRELRPQVVGVVKDTGEVIKEYKPVMGASLGVFLKTLEHLGVTESARLRISKEVTLFPVKPPEIGEDGNVVPISEGRKAGVQ
jgi:hypothetical protein